MFSDYVYLWLENALDYGITEFEFWEMTLAELVRAIDSKKRRMKLDAQDKAYNNYILADLIGQSIARLYSSAAKMPAIAEVYPDLFDNEQVEEKVQERKDELSIIRLKQFTEAFNKKFRGQNNE